jgi:hypothetical protein
MSMFVSLRTEVEWWWGCSGLCMHNGRIFVFFIFWSRLLRERDGFDLRCLGRKIGVFFFIPVNGRWKGGFIKLRTLLFWELRVGDDYSLPGCGAF